MKKTILNLLLFLACMSSCSKNDSFEKTEELSNPVIVSFESQISRVVGTSWENDDEVGISATGTDVTYTNVKYLSDASGKFTVSEGVQPICFTNKKPMSFTAYYPYSENGGIISANTATAPDKCNFLWAKQDGLSYSESPVVKFVFNHSMSEVVFNISSSEGLSLTDYQNPTVMGIKHQGSFNTETGEAKIDDTAQTEEWAINMKQGEGKLTYAAVLFPQTVNDLSLKVGDKVYSVEITPSTINMIGGETYNINMDVKLEKISAEVSIVGSEINGFDPGENFDASFTVQE